MAIFRPILAIGIVSFLFAFSAAHADQVLGAAADRDGRREITAVAATDLDQLEAAAIVVRADSDAILKTALAIPSDGAAGIMNFLTFGSEEHPDAEIYDIEISDPDTGGEVVTVAGHRKAGIGDLVAPSSMLLVGTALASFAFLTRRKRRHSRRAYFSKHSIVTLPRSRTASPQTSRSADSCEPNPRENSAHSSPRTRLA